MVYTIKNHCVENLELPHEQKRNIKIHQKAIPHPPRHHHQIRISRHHLQKPKNRHTLCHLLPTERTTFMEVQAEPDMIGNYIEMYHLAPAKHMDQKHWLAVSLDGSVSDSKVLDLLDMSYDLVDGQEQMDRQQTVRQKKKIDNFNHTFHNDDSGSRELTGKMGETT